jgi:hypothetical protein
VAGATRFLSFNVNARTPASAEGLGTLPALAPAERSFLAQLRH